MDGLSNEGIEITKNSYVNIIEDITLYAKWTTFTFTISFLSFEGSLVKPITQPHGTKLLESEPPTRDDFAFLGWYKDSEFDSNFKSHFVCH